MRRRDLLKGAGAIVGLGLTGCTPWVQDDTAATEAAPSLSDQLAELADARFSASAKGLSSQVLFDRLRQNGVLSTKRGINTGKLRSLARNEPLIQYQGFYYSRSELALYNLAYLVHRPTLGR
ncbi:twin-arginine translocation signal domain-containing protein [Marinobacter mangrovi]|uniref:twin-arginine translocation signal domain-containing protein n=1 Tax=Marinobacter mangrovi TaxID=2803918 RepID=UPI001933B309|nr:twin-arginine translocation signal domain-containing protein [Marinobacter mangrovi]